MQDDQMYPYSQSHSTVVDRNVVLQKTYRLLGLSFIPCALGATVPYLTGFQVVAYGWLGVILFLAFFYGMIFAIEKNRYSSTGVTLLMVFTFGMGIFLGSTLMRVSVLSTDGPKIIGMAALLTAIIFFSMASLSRRLKVNFNTLNTFMGVGALVLIVCIIASFFLQISAFSLAISGAIVVFSTVGIMHQLKSVLDAGETSHISVALGLFIHIFNLFINLIRIISSLTSSR